MSRDNLPGISIECADSEDRLEVKSLALGLGRIALTAVDWSDDDKTVIHLDERRARELFNWLGTWLHKY